MLRTTPETAPPFAGTPSTSSPSRSAAARNPRNRSTRPRVDPHLRTTVSRPRSSRPPTPRRPEPSSSFRRHLSAAASASNRSQSSRRAVSHSASRPVHPNADSGCAGPFQYVPEARPPATSMPAPRLGVAAVPPQPPRRWASATAGGPPSVKPRENPRSAMCHPRHPDRRCVQPPEPKATGSNPVGRANSSGPFPRGKGPFSWVFHAFRPATTPPRSGPIGSVPAPERPFRAPKLAEKLAARLRPHADRAADTRHSPNRAKIGRKP